MAMSNMGDADVSDAAAAAAAAAAAKLLQPSRPTRRIVAPASTSGAAELSKDHARKIGSKLYHVMPPFPGAKLEQQGLLRIKSEARVPEKAVTPLIAPPSRTRAALECHCACKHVCIARSPDDGQHCAIVLSGPAGIHVRWHRRCCLRQPQSAASAT